jgi:alpha-L-fucosidase 2
VPSPSRRSFLRTTPIGTTAIGATTLGSATAEAVPRVIPPGPAASGGMRSEREWAAFLAASDLRWKRLPANFYEGPFLGNGAFGAAVYRHPSRARLTFVLGDSRVRDHQEDAGGALFGHSRLRIGTSRSRRRATSPGSTCASRSPDRRNERAARSGRSRGLSSWLSGSACGG